jgi:hypothetical protein
MSTSCSSVGGLLLGLALALPTEVRAADAYYLLMFGSQRVPNNPKYAHTFTTFVHASWPGEPCGPPRLEVYTISWLSLDGTFRVLALKPECGRNWELHETIRYAFAHEERVSLWGPYQIDCELYRRAVNQVRLLESGRVLYKSDDLGYPTDRVTNCIHAVSSITEGYRVRILMPAWGETASYFVLREFYPWVIDRDRIHGWVGNALGLDQYPILYRDLEDPRSAGYLRAPFRAGLGLNRDVNATYGQPERRGPRP